MTEIAKRVHQLRRWQQIMALMMVLTMVGLAGLGVLAWRDKEAGEDRQVLLEERMSQNEAALAEANERLIEAGKTPIPLPPPTVIPSSISEIDDPDPDDPEIQDPEIPNPERQDPERQNAETQESERQEAEVQDGEIDNPDPDDPEIQDDEIQDDEIDDPDPASPFTFSFTFTIPGDNPAEPDRTYTVTCNSGTGNCTIS